MHPYYGGHTMMSGLGFGILGFILQIIIIVLVVWVMLFLLRRGRRGMHMRGMWHSHSALSLLNERYAKGEITKEEFEERRKTLVNM